MKILNRLPFSLAPSVVSTPNGILAVKSYQIIVMVSVTARGVAKLPEEWPRFPAILDTGTNHNFAIREDQLERWASLRLRQRGTVRIRGEVIPLFAGSVWIHSNRPGTMNLAEGRAVQLQTPDGLIVYPESASSAARLPVVGLRALVRNHLTLIVDGNRCEVTLKTPGWF
jgi:hypothetical protein